MKADVFLLKSQRDLYAEIAASLTSQLYERIEVRRRELDDDYSEDSAVDQHAIGKDYLDLLKASMIKSGDFTVQMEDHHGNWVYMGNHSRGEYFLRLFRPSLTAIFPAVAIMGRMVMVPHAIRAAFDSPSDFSYLFKPLDLQGVLLVDFQDARGVRTAVSTASRQLKAEIATLCRQYMSLRRIPAPDVQGLTWLSELLGISLGFVEKYRDEILVPAPQLAATITSGAVRMGRPSRVVLELEAKDAVGNVRVQVRAPARTLRAQVVEYLDFSPGRSTVQNVPFEVTARTPPYCPIEIIVVVERPQQLSLVLPPVLLDVTD